MQFFFQKKFFFFKTKFYLRIGFLKQFVYKQFLALFRFLLFTSTVTLKLKILDSPYANFCKYVMQNAVNAEQKIIQLLFFTFFF